MLFFSVGISGSKVTFFRFPNLVETIAHELAHCLLSDFNLEWAESHDDERHGKLTQDILKWLWEFTEVKMLDKIVKEAEEKIMKEKTLKDKEN